LLPSVILYRVLKYVFPSVSEERAAFTFKAIHLVRVDAAKTEVQSPRRWRQHAPQGLHDLIEVEYFVPIFFLQ
jgi:hypothetical protein